MHLVDHGGGRSVLATLAIHVQPNPVIKCGIAIKPIKFGISLTATLFNQAGALVHVYTDGSVQVNHGGAEMGQGLNTMVAQIVAAELGVPYDRILCAACDITMISNASATAASARHFPWTTLAKRDLSWSTAVPNCTAKQAVTSAVPGLANCTSPRWS